MACPTHVAYPSQTPICRIFVVKSGRPKSKPYNYNDSLPNSFHFTITPLQNQRPRLRLVRKHRLLLLLLLPKVSAHGLRLPFRFSTAFSRVHTVSEIKAAINTLSLPRLLNFFDAPHVRLRSWQGMACPIHVAYPSQMPICRIFDVKSGRPKSKPYKYHYCVSNTLHFTMFPLQNPRHRLGLVRQHRLLLLLRLP